MIDRKIAKFKLRRGTNAERAGVVFDAGELVYTTDTYDVYVGDGSTAGGRMVGGNTLVSAPNLSADDTTTAVYAPNKLSIKTSGISAVHFSQSVAITARGLTALPAGIGINYDSTTLQVVDGQLKVNPSATYTVNPVGGLVNTVHGVSANTDNTTIKVIGNVIKVGVVSAAHIADGSINRSKLDDSGTDSIVLSSKGLSASRVNGLSLKVKNTQFDFEPTGELRLLPSSLSSNSGTTTTGTYGYQKMPGNFMMQWGSIDSLSSHKIYEQNFGIPFTDCQNVQLTLTPGNVTLTMLSAQRNATPLLSTKGVTKFSFYIDSDYTEAETKTYKHGLYWFAIGKY
jgi:hypothetical protein